MPADERVERTTVRDILLTRRGLVFVDSAGPPLADDVVRALELELADLGFVLSSRLRARIARASIDEVVALRAWAVRVLAAHLGADQKHEPLFRRFPEGIPDDTTALWWTKVLSHYLQAEGQPCLFCGKTGTTHVLDPCRHVVCDRCFDGANYSACPVCERQVNRDSPFFQPSPERGTPDEEVVFQRLDLGDDADAAARALFASFCARKQAMSVDDRAALRVVLEEYRSRALAWLPEAIPVRENVAVVFGTLFGCCDADDVLPPARRFLKTATDVMRFLAVLSGADPSLPRELVGAWVRDDVPLTRFTGATTRIVEMSRAARASDARYANHRGTWVAMRVRRFKKMARLPRPLRRALLAVLEGFDADALVEDMMRHRPYWVAAGELLHPGEYAKRFPNVARAFAIVRGKAPDGTPAPAFEGYHARLERAVRRRDVDALVGVLGERPGELARRFDHALRLAAERAGEGEDPAAVDRVVSAFVARVRAFATPVLLTLHSQLPTRLARAPVRVYWPKGDVARGYQAPDLRAVLPARAVDAPVAAIEAELLRRFAAKPRFDTAIVDEALRAVPVPFNERTASSGAVAVPRGSRVAIPAGKVLRLFLHWCQPEGAKVSTDIDLSVGFYDGKWQYEGVCSYYQLKMVAKSARGAGAAGARAPASPDEEHDDPATIALSAGDRQDAPWPDGATELVDVHIDRARAEGLRYAVMVVNNYYGMPFGTLERAFAGLMLREDTGGRHFDPRTVELKFALTGDNGVFLPLVVDLERSELHWLDMNAEGMPQFNNVRTSNRAIQKVCPALMGYFASGVRPSMYELGLMHAAARCERVVVRGGAGADASLYVRRPGEDARALYARLERGEADEPRARVPPAEAEGGPWLAALYRGDLALPPGSEVYALFREQVVPTLAASDLLS